MMCPQFRSFWTVFGLLLGEEVCGKVHWLLTQNECVQASTPPPSSLPRGSSLPRSYSQ